MTIRLLTTKHSPASMNMAIDEALIESVANGASLPTLRLYGWQPAAVSIGYFQSLGEEIDTDTCAKNGVEIVRRMTGGGAVFHDTEITYSMHIPEKLGLVPNGILESYRAVSEGIIQGLSLFGVQAQFVPLNDIVAPYTLTDPDGTHSIQMRKISGNAQTRKQGVIVQHGTILLSVDVEKMFSILKVPDEKMKGKLIADIKQRVAGLDQLLGRNVSFDEAEKAFIEGFKKAFPGEEFASGELTADELARVKTLSDAKYSQTSWNASR